MEHIFGRTRKILELSRKAEEIFGKAKIREALMKEKDMYDTLNHLLNEKISYITRAVNMLCLGIGDCITILDTKGNMVEKSVMSLHIQSEWRITNRKKYCWLHQIFMCPIVP